MLYFSFPNKDILLYCIDPLFINTKDVNEHIQEK